MKKMRKFDRMFAPTIGVMETSLLALVEQYSNGQIGCEEYLNKYHDIVQRAMDEKQTIIRHQVTKYLENTQF